MKIERTKLYLYLYIMVATFILLLFNNVYVFCVVEIMLLIILVNILKYDLKHPLVLFLTVFILYQIAFPILNTRGIIVYENVTMNDKYYITNWLATASFIVFFGKLVKVNYDSNKIHSDINVNIIKIIYIVIALIAISGSIYIIMKGYNSKYEIAQGKSVILTLGDMAYTTLSSLTLYFFVGRNIKSKSKISWGIATFLLLLFGVFTFGERNYIFDYVVVLTIYYFTFKKIELHKIILLGIACVVLLELSSTLKMLWTSNKYKYNNNNLNYIEKFLNSDFASAGFNFNYLLNNCETKFYGKTYIYDFLSPIDDIVPVAKKYSPTKWYQNEYWRDRKTGLGFSILGEGYLNFGIIGIAIEMFLLARMIKYMYLISNKNSYYYVLYLGFTTLAMYSSREALGNIISPFFKYHILIAIFIYLISKRKDRLNEKIIK